MLPILLPFDERLKLIRDLVAVTHVCHTDGCDAEVVITCHDHPICNGDDTDYEDIGFCAEHYGIGFGGKCNSCLPTYGPPEKWVVMLNTTIRPYMFALAGELAKDIENRTEWFKLSDTINVPLPQRWKAKL